MSFRASILPTLYTNVVNEGEAVTFSFNEEDLPLPHDYSYEWIAGGIAGGWTLDGSTNSSNFTITPDSPYYKDGFIVACRITNVSGSEFFYTGEAKVSIIPMQQPEPQNPTAPEVDNTNNNVIPTVNEKVVKTNDTITFDVYGGLLMLSVMLLLIKVKQINR